MNFTIGKGMRRRLRLTHWNYKNTTLPLEIWALLQCDYKNYVRIRKEAKIEDELTKKEYDLLKEELEQ